MDQPFAEGELYTLAQACEERAWELQARAWQSEAERNALREATAELLTSVARRLARHDASAGTGLDCAGVREFIAHQVVHGPLQLAQYHAWVAAYEPGGKALEPTDSSEPAE